jgi:small conductance mechanosensitive channel
MRSIDNIIQKDFIIDLAENIKEWIITDSPGLVILIILFVVAYRSVGYFIKRFEKILVNRTEKRNHNDSEESVKRIDTLIGIIHGGLKIVLWAVLIMMVLRKIGVNIGPILASAGIIGLAVGFGAQELVRDFISGFFMILENQIRINDVAILNGTAGLVESIELRTTTLRDFSGVVHVFQNGKIDNIANMTKDWSAIVLDIGVAYKENIQQVMDFMKQTGDELKEDKEFNDKILEPIEIFGLDKFGDSALIIKARFKTKPGEQWAVGREFRKRLKTIFDQHNIEIPFPHTTLYWGEEIDPLKLNISNNNNTGN